jgi:hypothetical protein
LKVYAINRLLKKIEGKNLNLTVNNLLEYLLFPVNIILFHTMLSGICQRRDIFVTNGKDLTITTWPLNPLQDSFPASGI